MDDGCASRLARGVAAVCLTIWGAMTAAISPALVAACGGELAGGEAETFHDGEPAPATRVVVHAAALAPAPRAASAAIESFGESFAADPDRVLVHDAAGKWLATFTFGARTVTLRGPARTFEETTAAHAVNHRVWVRLLPAPFDGAVDSKWLKEASSSKAPDLLATAFEYTAGALAVAQGNLVIAGDACYGPLLPDGTRAEGSDFNDYLGVSWSYPEKLDAPEADQFGCLDCSGFVRMLFGYRGGVPLGLDPVPGADRLPRRAWQMHEAAPGVVVAPDTGIQQQDFSRLAPGDLVFFDVSSDDGPAIDHVGVYLGRDRGGRHRFVSSRKKANGPTMGDVGGASVLDGTGLYAKALRAVRRL